MTEIATIQQTSLAVSDEQAWWTDRQIAGLRQIGVENASEGDLLVFFHVCQRTGLDPFARQIHMVGRNAKDDRSNQWVTKYTIQTGIDGFRLIADRADRRDGTLREYEDTLWCDADGNWSDVWTKATAPTAAKVTVLRSGKRFPATVLYREYVQTKRDGNPNAMWSRMPANQLAKCAEAAALRKAYPQDLSGLYADEEMGQADNHRSEQAQPSGGLGAALAAQEPTAEPATEATLDEPTDDTLTDHTRRQMFALLNERGVTDRDAQIAGISAVIGRQIESRAEVTEPEAQVVIASLRGVS